MPQSFKSELISTKKRFRHSHIRLNNTGYFNPYTLNEWLLRFSLWTYEKTDGYLMVSDLQGVLTEKGYVLTDPVILCKDELRFGTTNMGPEAMERVRVSAKAHLDEMRATV